MADPAYNSKIHRDGRAYWTWYLTNIGPVPCVEGCGHLVYADPAMNWDGQPWHLCHGLAVRHGGTGEDSGPGHTYCNDSKGYLISQTNPVTTYDW